MWMFRSFSRVRELVPASCRSSSGGSPPRRSAPLADAECAPGSTGSPRPPGAPPGRRRPGPRRALPLLRRAACSQRLLARSTPRGASTSMRSRPTPSGRTARPCLDAARRLPAAAARGLLRRWLATSDDRPSARSCSRSTPGGSTASASCATCGSGRGRAPAVRRRLRLGTQAHPPRRRATPAGLPARPVAGRSRPHSERSDPADREVVVDLATWRRASSRRRRDRSRRSSPTLLAGCDFGRPLRRLDLTVTTRDGDSAGAVRTQHLTYRPAPDGGFVEDPLYRNLHPMLAKRLDLWRLAQLPARAAASAEDVYLFHGVAHDNPKDHRLFALAEVRDLTPCRDAGRRARPTRGWSGWACRRWPRCGRRWPASRTAGAARGEPDRALRPPAVGRPAPRPGRRWPRSFAPLADGAGLEKVVLRVRMPGARTGSATPSCTSRASAAAG